MPHRRRAHRCPRWHPPRRNDADLNRGGQDNVGDACDDNIAGDGYTNAAHTALGKDPTLHCATMRADVNGDGKVQLADLIIMAGKYNQPVPPAPGDLQDS